jgi:WD40 repeat protein
LEPLPENFGAYHPIGVLGEGGMGIVYLAEQEKPIRRRVALKVIKLGMDTHDVVARFESERQALALMDHPNIAHVYDAGATPEGRPYFAMEYVPGIPITDYCDRHLLGMRQRLDLFVQVCQAIHHAHQKGVIHRDIKPSNVLVMIQDGKPVPKVIDFGVAKATNQRLTEKTVFTEIGVLIGTPAYMSPEQAEMTGLDVDTSTDIYSLGVLLYELLVGALPFDPQSLRKAGHDEIRRVIREEEPPRPTAKLHWMGATASEVARHRHTDVRTLARFLRGDLDWITMKAIEKDRTRRYASASEFAADLVRHLQDEPVHAGPPGAAYRARKFARKHRTGVAAVAGLLLVSLACAGVSTALFFRAEREKREAQRQSYVSNVHAADLHLRSFEANAARRQLLLCDPKLRGWEWRHLWSRADSSLATLKASFDFVTWPYFTTIAFGSNGERIYWDTQFALHVWDGSSYEAVANYGGFGEILAISQDGGKILARRAHALSLIEAAVGTVLAKFKIDADNLESAALSNDGHRAATSSKDGRLQVWDLPSGTEIASIQSGPATRGVAFSPDGLRIAAAGYKGLRVWDVRLGRLIFKMEDVEVSSRSVFSADGASLMAGTRGRVLVWDVNSGRVKLNQPGSDAEVEAVAFSPDGTLIATASRDQSVRILNAVSGATLAVLTGNSFSEPSAAAFSPDGERLFVATEIGEIHVWDVRTYGGSGLRPMEHDIASAAVSPDGTRLAVALDNQTVRVLDASSGKSLVEWQDRAPGVKSGQGRGAGALAFSPDGSRIALGGADGTIRLRDSRSGRELADLPGHTAGIASISFDPTGAYLVSGSRDSSVRVWSLSSRTTVARLAMRDVVNSVVFSPQGDRILIASGDTSTSADDTTVQLWEWRKDGPPRKLTGGQYPDSATTAAVFSPDGSEIAAVRSAYPEVVFWDASSWKWTGADSTDDGGISTIAFSPDGSRFVTESDKGVTRVWDAGTHERLVSLDTGDNSAHLAAFSPDSSTLYTAAGNRIRIWETRSAYPPGMQEVLESVRGKFDLMSEVMDRLRTDRKIDPGLREAALRQLRAGGERVYELNSAIWDVVKDPKRTPSDYRRALRAAEAVVKCEPWTADYVHTLGVAQYRCGQFREALASLQRAPGLRSQPGQGDMLFTAMTHFKLGEVETAQAKLKIVQDRKRNGASLDAERLAFLEEAEALISASKAKQ